MSKHGISTDAPPAAATIPATEDTLGADRWIDATLGKYRITRRLGKGGMGVVYEAIDPMLQRSVAIKMLRDSIADNPESVRKFIKEARTAAKVNHPQVVAVYEVNEEKGVCYLVMELMDCSAHDRISKWGPFGWVEATLVTADACRGLAAVHAAGLIHRDVKPSNIMQAADGSVKITDFGLAHADPSVSDSGVPKGQVVGTPLYMSPEQCQAKPIDRRSDIYAMGATYFSLLTGKPPFEGKSAMEIMYGHCQGDIPNPCTLDPNIPAACADLIRKIMAKNPDDRPADALAVVKEIEAILASVSSPDVPPIGWTSGVKPEQSGVSTVVEPITPIGFEPAPSKTRNWFVLAGLILIGASFIVGRYAAQHPQLPPPDPSTDGPVIVERPPPEQKKDVEEKGVTTIEAGGPVASLAFDPTYEARIAWATSDGKQVIYSRADRTGKELASVAADTSMKNQVAYWPKDGSCLSLGDGKLRVFQGNNGDLDADETALCNVAPKEMISFAVHPTERILAFALHDRGKDPKDGFLVRRFQKQALQSAVAYLDNRQVPTCLAFSADGRYLFAGQENAIITRWAVNPQNKPLQPKVDFDLRSDGRVSFRAGPIIALAPLSNSKIAAAIGRHVWLLTSNNEFQKLSPLHGGDANLPTGDAEVTALATAPAANRLACAVGDKVFVYLDDGTKLGEYKSPSPRVTAMALNKDGDVLAYGGADGKIVIRVLDLKK